MSYREYNRRRMVFRLLHKQYRKYYETHMAHNVRQVTLPGELWAKKQFKVPGNIY